MLNEKSFFGLFEMTPDLVCIVNREGYFQKINPAVSATLGYSVEELMAGPVARLIHPSDRERTAANRQRLLDGIPLLNFQNRYLTKQGETVWLEWTSVYLPEKALVFDIAKNITSGKIAEMELAEKLDSLQKLNTQVKQYSEKERRQIAYALHEDVAQLAAVIKNKVEWLFTQQLPAQNHELLQQTIASTTQLLNKVRHISYSLSADALFVQGLHESLRDLCSEFSRSTGIECTYKGHCSEDLLSKEEGLDVYRVCQEALQNVSKHAVASNVIVKLAKNKKGVRLAVADNGVGFDVMNTVFSGINIMKARALSIGATLKINSSANGTTVCLQLKAQSSVEEKLSNN